MSKLTSIKNYELTYNLNFFGDTLSVTLNHDKNIKYGEIMMKKFLIQMFI